MAYEIVSELSFDYSGWTGFAGEAVKIEFEVQGIPGLAQHIAWDCEQWVRLHGLTIEAFAIYQDTTPLFDKYKVYMVFHESPVAQAILILIGLLIGTIALLGVTFGVWRISTVIFAPPKPPLDKETIKAIGPIIDKVNTMDIPADQKASILKALLEGAGKAVAGPVSQWVLIAAIGLGAAALFLLSRSSPLVVRAGRA